ncbi:MAG: hypothetical protein Q8W51_09695 [Candidatus Palauibacterales bacterium]|nr:hypothetical protein [Candidatus Palauibacterales bacterium]MDP2530002.1 hypothetical protein [Candidatus Palauibacterales bacterium]MDP2585031.1 hypothetical protein [Candidatus Palauibacterales bacterium]
MSERRYTEDEVTTIFERAAEARPEGRRRLASGEGLTLADLQEIGREVGIAPEAVAHAAASLDRSERPARRTFLGFPIGVGRSLELGRRLTEEEWERLVVDLRDTFDARGRVRVDGNFRQWTNGNLQALLEPTPEGQRLRLRTYRENSRVFMMGGLGLLGLGTVAAIARFLTAGLDPAVLARVSPLLLIGLGLVGLGAIRLPSWARRRGRQMEGVLSRVAAMVSAKPAELPGDGATGADASTPG